MNMTRRLFSLLLAICMVLTMIPAPVFAEEVSAEPLAEEFVAEPTEAAAPAESEATEENTEISETMEFELVEDITEPIPEETASIVEEDLPLEVITTEEIVVPDADGWPTDDELYATYVEGLFYNNLPAVFGTAAGERLTGNTKLAYDALKPYIQAIAKGEKSDTQITLGYSHYGINLNGVVGDYLVDIEVPFEGTAFDSTALLQALIADLPYDLYWFDKTTGMSCSWFTVNDQLQWTVSFTVAGGYGPSGPNVAGGYYVSTNYIKTAVTAAENAKAVITAAASLSDYEKLVYYKENICNAVSYDWDAYNGSLKDDNYYMFHIDSWQLTNVFDEDTSTNVVCEGYAKAFQYLCDMTKFDGDVVCYGVTGTMNNGGHMWNIVSIDDENYLVDVTNSDADMVGQNGGLFLVGGTITNNAYRYTIGTQSVAFRYDEEMYSIYDSDILTLSANAVYEPDDEDTSVDFSCAHSFVDGVCNACGVYGGMCGDAVYWSLESNGLLHIYGTGAITSSPWADYVADVTAIQIDEGITEVGDSCLGWCENATVVSLPQTLTILENYAFCSSTSLSSINLEHITEIGDYAFSNCDSLTKVTIPGAVQSIGAYAFNSCDMLATVHLEEGIESIGAYVFKDCIKLTGLTLPESMDTLGDGVFYGCDSLTEIAIPEGITVIPDRCFIDCWYLADVTLPEGLTAIGREAFFNATSMEQITIPESVASIGSWAFACCNRLKNVYFLGDVPEFTGNVFFDTTATVYYPADNESWTEDVMQNYGGTITWIATCIGGHSEIIDEAVAATCTEDGLTEGSHCSVCGQTIVPQEVIAANGHTEVTDEAVEATCTHTGLTEGKHCKICGEVTVAQEAIPMKDHIFQDNKCTVCNEEHFHENVQYIPWTSTTSLPTEAGYYYLTKDVILSSAWSSPAGETILCLHGHSITGNYTKTIGDGSSLILEDCSDVTGLISCTSGLELNCFTVNAGGTLTLDGAAIEVSISRNLGNNSDAVSAIYNSGGNVNILSGTIRAITDELVLKGAWTYGIKNVSGIVNISGGNLYAYANSYSSDKSFHSCCVWNAGTVNISGGSLIAEIGSQQDLDNMYAYAIYNGWQSEAMVNLANAPDLIGEITMQTKNSYSASVGENAYSGDDILLTYRPNEALNNHEIVVRNVSQDTNADSFALAWPNSTALSLIQVGNHLVYDSGDLHEHSWTANNCEEIRFCSVCEYTDGAIFEHSYGDWSTISEPTFSEIGQEQRLCSTCGDVEFRDIAMLQIIATVNETPYASLQEALDAAESGDIVTLNADTEIETLLIPAGITLDLNSYNVIAESAAVFNGGSIVDTSSNSSGVLNVPKNSTVFSLDNYTVPIWTGDGYLFADVTNFQKATRAQSGNPQYLFLPTFEEVAHSYLSQGSNSSAVKFALRIEWEDDIGTSSRNFIYSDNLVKQVMDSYSNGRYNKVFSAIIKNGSSIDYTLSVVLILDNGQEIVIH